MRPLVSTSSYLFTVLPLGQGIVVMQLFCLQLLTSRNTLLIAAQKTAVLHTLYRDQLTRLEEEKSHAYLRCQPLTSSSHLPSDRQLEEFVRLARDSKNTTQLDRYVPHLSLPLFRPTLPLFFPPSLPLFLPPSLPPSLSPSLSLSLSLFLL